MREDERERTSERTPLGGGGERITSQTEASQRVRHCLVFSLRCCFSLTRCVPLTACLSHTLPLSHSLCSLSLLRELFSLSFTRPLSLTLCLVISRSLESLLLSLSLCWQSLSALCPFTPPTERHLKLWLGRVIATRGLLKECPVQLKYTQTTAFDSGCCAHCSLPPCQRE